MGAVFDIGIILLVGYIGGRIATFLKLPAIIGYLIVGILLEPGVLGILPPHFISQSEIATNLALAVITFAIGGSLALSKIKKLGKSIVCITVFEAEFAFILVAVGMTFVIGWGGSLLQSLPMALLLAAMASPTDPTAILAIVDEYKTDGPVTRTLMAVAASDDALGIMNFSMATAFATALLFGARYLTIDNLVWSPLFIILSSIVAGIAFGAILTLVSKIMKHQGALLAILFGTLFTCFGLTTYLGLDQLLSLLVIGVVFVNFSTRNKEVFSLLSNYFEDIIFIIFFVLAGANLNLGTLAQYWVWIVAFIILRSVGKISGAYLGATISGASPAVKKYMPLGLLPQGGIVMGLALLVQQNPNFSQYGSILISLIVGTTVIQELLGPILTKYALYKAGEIRT